MNIKGFPNYEVTKQGKVINLITGRTLKPDTNRTGYLRVTLSRDGKTKRFFIHRLVALHYLPNPEMLKEVNHIDGNKTNNDVSNLEWNSSSQNKKHAVENGLGTGSGRTYMTESQVHDVCILLEKGTKYGEISKLVGVSYNAICLIKIGKCWKEISRQYKF